RLLARHANLRAAFRHGGLERPVQVILRAAEPPWTELDLSGLGEAALAEALASDRGHRFDLGQGPLIRFMLIRLGPERHRLVITNHHILLDGWSTPLLLRELFALYRAGGSAEGLPRVTPFRDYLGWLRRQDGQAAEAAWREALQGLEEPTRLAPRRSTAAAMPETVSVSLTAERTAALTRQARRLGLTVNTLVQGAWGILLGRLTGRDDVVFGVTVSGRPAELPGIEAMVGLLINTLPLRLRLRPAEPLAALLARLQEEQSRLLAHQHLGLTRIQQIAGFADLFDTLLVFEN
ncbi:non-ribosomal peptide synthetase, partial [Mycobacterium sp. KBS0706]|uniref:condensation domain-containing protein n=1 Tax=Mycobacterium sp. KBS0706 TaxID=2578109 RepID=UPI0011936C8F